MSTVLFRTPGAIPLDAFTKFGINAKPNSVSPFGFFGTGLKYAVSIILRNGGTIRVFIQGVEFNFYLHNKDFRGKAFREVRMRKRKRGMTSWLRSEALPFTTELGKNWGLWQAYRELESNTRDEGGESGPIEANEFIPDVSGTDILIDCEGFAEAAGEAFRTHEGVEVASRVFLPPRDTLRLVYDCDQFSAYEGASDHFYYQGIRVYDLRNPSRLTYDFKPGKVQLSEDRSAKNIWDMQYYMSHKIQEIQDVELLTELLEGSANGKLWFETDDLTFYTAGNRAFATAAQAIKRPGRNVRGWIGSYKEALPYGEQTSSVTLSNRDWQHLLSEIQFAAPELYDEIKDQLPEEAEEEETEEAEEINF